MKHPGKTKNPDIKTMELTVSEGQTHNHGNFFNDLDELIARYANYGMENADFIDCLVQFEKLLRREND